MQVSFTEMNLYNVVFHHEGEFVRPDKNKLLYMGEVQIIVFGQNIENWTMFKIHNLVKCLGYKEGSYRVWTKIVEIIEIYF